MKRNNLFIILATLALFLLAACGSGSNASADLVGPVWVLSTLNNRAPLPNTMISAEFSAEGVVSGSAGCNNYNTSYSVDGDSISFGEQIASTQKLCPAPENLQEQGYFQALSDAETFAIDGEELVLRDADGNDIAVYAAQSQAMEGSSWQVISYNNGREAVVSVTIGTEITANFGEDGQLTGNAGCNDYNASYEVDGESISIGPAAATRKLCAEPEGIMAQEAEYLAALETAATFRIEANSMNMRTAEGATVANFSRAPGK